MLEKERMLWLKKNQLKRQQKKNLLQNQLVPSKKTKKRQLKKQQKKTR